MSVDIGIIGLAQSGRTTLFNSLTRGAASPVGVAKLPDPRLDGLAAMLKPRRVVPAETRYIDIGATVTGPAREKGISGPLLAQLSQTDALISVVRTFASDTVPHVEGSLDVGRDIAAMNLELAFSDMAIIERRLEKIEVSLKGAKPAESQGFHHEQSLLLRIKAELEKEVPLREQSLTADEARLTANYQFLTAKPLLIVVNIGEDQLPEAASLEAELAASYARPGCRVATLCAQLEMELAQLDDEAAAELRREYGLAESGLDCVARLAYELLGLISFFTTASAEVKAWSVRRGTPALGAAGKIHSDMERGFIRAEVIGYEDLVNCGSTAEARRRGLLRLEGKNYVVQDGDVITFLFNV